MSTTTHGTPKAGPRESLTEEVTNVVQQEFYCLHLVTFHEDTYYLSFQLYLDDTQMTLTFVYQQIRLEILKQRRHLNAPS